MDISWQMRRRLLFATVVVLTLLLLLMRGCQFRPAPVSAFSHSDGSEQIVGVTIRSADARTIKRRQLYFSVKIINCTGHAMGYPAMPSIEGVSDSFNFPINGELVLITARVPARIFAEYAKPCAFLEGGGYFTGTIKSETVPIQDGFSRGT